MAFDQEEILILRKELFSLLNCIDNIADSENPTTTTTTTDAELTENNRNLEQQLSQIKLDSERYELELSQIKADHEKCQSWERELSQFKFDHVLLVQTLEKVRSEKENLIDANQKLALDNEGNFPSFTFLNCRSQL
jgi:hypothetical protein